MLPGLSPTKPPDHPGSRRRVLVAFVLCALCALCACRDSGGGKDKSSSPRGGAPGDAAVASQPVMRIMLNGVVVARPTRDEVAKRPNLSSLMPPEARDERTWKMIEARAREPKFEYLSLPKPAANYPGQVAKVFIDRKGKVAFGMELTGDRPAFTVMRSGIKVVNVHTRVRRAKPPGAQSPPRAAADLSVEVDGEVHSVAPAALSKLGRIAAAEQDANGWHLRDVIALVTPVAGVAKVRLVAAEPVDVDGAELADDQIIAMLKINRRGQYRFKMWRLDGEQRSLIKEARDVSALQLTSKK